MKPWTEARNNKYMKYHSKLTYQLSFWNVSRKVDYHGMSTLSGLVMPFGNLNLGQHWLRIMAYCQVAPGQAQGFCNRSSWYQSAVSPWSLLKENMRNTVVGGNPTSTWKHITHIQRQVSRVVSTLASTYCLTKAPSTSAAASWVIHLTSLKLNMFLFEKLGSVVLRVRLTKWVHKL